MSTLARISLAIPEDLVGALDARVDAAGLGNRSEVVRDLVRAWLAEDGHADEPVVGTLTLLYDHHDREVAKDLISHGHEHAGHVIATLHVHLDHDTCLEVVAVQGTRGHLRAFTDHLRHLRGVRQASLALLPRS